MRSFLLVILALIHLTCSRREPIEVFGNSIGVRDKVARADSLYNALEGQAALRLLQELYQQIDQFENSADKAFISGKLGRHYLYAEGDINAAEDVLVRQRDLLEKMHLTDSTALARCYLDLSFLHTKKQELPFARSYALMARDLAPGSPTDSILQAEVCIALGKIHTQLLEYDTSLEYYHKARVSLNGTNYSELQNTILIGLINIFNNIPVPDSSLQYLSGYHDLNINDTAALAEYYRLRGIHYYIADDYLKSIVSLEKAVRLFKISNDFCNPYSAIDALVVLSAAYRYNGQFSEALEVIDSALVRKFGSKNDPRAFQADITSIGYIASKAEIIADSAIMIKDTSLALEALDMYDFLDSLRRYFIKLDIDSYLYQQFYDNYMYWKPVELLTFLHEETGSKKWLYHMHDVIAAYKAQGFNRDRVLNTLYFSPAGKTPAFQKYVKNDIAMEIAIREDDFSEMNMLIRERQEILGDIKQDIPDIVSRVIDATNISADELLRITQEQQKAVINFYIGDIFYNESHIYILIAVHGEFKLQVIDNSSEIIALADTLYEMHKLAASESTMLDTLFYMQTGHRLFNELLNETLDHLEDISEIIFIPDQALHTLAIEGLITHPIISQHTGTALSTVRYLIEDYEIAYAFSPNDLIDQENHEEPNSGKDLLVMSYSSPETLVKPNDSIPELSSSYRELQAIRRVHGEENSKYWSGFDCSKENFLKYATQAEIIHLSTHGTYDLGDRTSSMLYLRNESGLEMLYQHELRYKNIKPRLLVLSACDSGAGKRSNEEGMLSIGRTFQAFGAEMAITALWPLSGNAGVQVFERLYKEPYDTQKKTIVALRNAKLEMIKSSSRYRLPGYWAGLILHI